MNSLARAQNRIGCSFNAAWIVIIAVLPAILFPMPANAASGDKKIIIAGSHDYAPFYFRDADGNLTGIFVDIWSLWARKTNVAVEFKSMTFAEVLQAVQDGEADIVAGFFYSTQRAQIFDFSQPFYEIHTHTFFHKSIQGIEQLKDLTGFKIGVVKGDYAQTYVQQRLPTAALTEYDNYEDLIIGARNGFLKVFICDTPVALTWLAKYGLTDVFNHTETPLYTSKIFAGVKKGNAPLLAQINTGLGSIIPEEKKELAARWQGTTEARPLSLRLMALIGAGLVAVAAILALLNYQLRRRIARTSADLKQKQQHLSDSEQALQKINENLEARVQQHTTQLKESNALLEVQVARHAETEAKLAQQNAYLTGLHETMLGLIRRLNVNELLDDIINRATQGAGSKHGYIYLLDPARNQLILRVGRGLFAETIGFRMDIGSGLAGKVVEARRHMLIDDYQNWTGRHPDAHWDDIHTIMGIPLKSETAIVGVIGICHVEDRKKFDQNEIDFLTGFAELASIALDNARLYAELQKELADRKQNEILRRKLEERIQHAQKMEAIGTLAGGIAHDFNNILSSILGYIELAQIDTPGRSQLTHYLENAHQAGLRAKDLVQQILTFSRKGRQQERVVSLTPIIKEVVKLLRASIPATIDIRQRIETEDAVVAADPVQIHQVLMNLGTNAAHAMEEDGGLLEITLGQVDVDEPDDAGLADLKPGRYAQLMIKDTGQGMPDEVRERIFEPYFTTKEMERGTGLGLSVVHGIVTRHDGHIGVRSEPGQGACFTIHLPLHTARTPRPVKTIEPAPRGTERILFIDDEAELVDIGRQALEYLGYQVTTCDNGQDALNLFRQSPDAFDVVITDMTMPQLTGDKLARALLEIRPQLPIIVCTGYSHRMSPEKAQEIGIRSFLMKPLVVDTLARTIRDSLE